MSRAGGHWQERRRAERRGRLAELAAAWFLRAKGYRILETRWRCRVGEIDLIALRGNVLVFIEVKLRPDHDAGVIAVTPRNRRRIEAAADQYLRFRKLSPPPPCRYDLVTVSGWSLRHHKNAWRSGDN